MVSRSPSLSSPYDTRSRPVESHRKYLIYHSSGIAQGPLIPPRERVHNMGNANATTTLRAHSTHGQPTQRSNLTALLEGQEGRSSGVPSRESLVNEADSASGPSSVPSRMSHIHSAPASVGPDVHVTPPSSLPRSSSLVSSRHRTHSMEYPRRSSAGDVASVPVAHATLLPVGDRSSSRSVRRCMSSKELGMLAPPTGSPYAFMLHQQEVLQATMQQRLMELRESSAVTPPVDRSVNASPAADTSSEGGSLDAHHRTKMTKQERDRRRAEHTKAVIADLCEIVTDLFVAESKLLNPSMYGVQPTSVNREEVLHSIEDFLSCLPTRYALGADTPSEVLVHMRLMAAVRADHTRAVVHIVEGCSSASFHCRPSRSVRLVTISCQDTVGLLEYITKLLATGGSRVLDADVMMSTDGIILDRFVVEMKGRLRLDKLANCIEAFMANAREQQEAASDRSEQGSPDTVSDNSPPKTPLVSSPVTEPSGPIYVFPPSLKPEASPRELHDEIQSAVPLTEVLESHNSSAALGAAVPSRSKATLRRGQSMPSPPMQPILSTSSPDRPQVRNTHHRSNTQPLVPTLSRKERNEESDKGSSLRQRRPLVNREATNFGDDDIHEVTAAGPDYVAVAPQSMDTPPSALAGIEDRVIPLIPFEELMLIETLGMGRVSTIYRAAWQRSPMMADMNGVEMVALKVATVNPDSGDTSHVDELRREADIAAMLQHNNVCELIGVAADAECFCLAYEFCEGGSLLSLLLDTTRYYEYLPIALDIANGMAYLHSRQVVHRDLKPSNVLLSRDHRAKIADFGMSVADTGQELTSETGTYRYMAPEVIRHESYSSNADVYSFGIVLWQLITREVPFATMTPIQAAFAVAEGRRPEIPPTTPPRLQEIITSCWDQDSHARPSFTYITMALADYARLAFSPANVGAQTLQIANEMLANVEGNSTVNVDFSTAVPSVGRSNSMEFKRSWLTSNQTSGSYSSNVGLEI